MINARLTKAVKEWQSRFRYDTLPRIDQVTLGEPWRTGSPATLAKRPNATVKPERPSGRLGQGHECTTQEILEKRRWNDVSFASFMAFHLFYVQRYATILSLIVDRSLASCQTTFKRGTCWSHQAPRRSTGRRPMLSASSAKTGPAKACTKSFMATSRPSRACATERTWRFQSGGMCEKKQKHLLKSCDLHTCHKTDLRMDKRLSISTKSLNPVGTVLVTLSTCTLQTTWTHSAWCLLWCVRHWSGILVPYINHHKSISFPKSWLRKLCKKGTKLASPQWAEPVKRPGCVFVVHFTMERRNGP